MARKRIVKKDHENLSDGNIRKVISLLEAESPITKKEACEILNIRYSTVRLGKIIDEFKERQEYIAKRKKALRGKPVQDYELKEIVTHYLNGTSISKIADFTYRSPSFLKRFIESLGLPERDSGATYQKPGLLPDSMVADEFYKGELVWSSRYNSVAEVMSVYGTDENTESPIYRLWVLGTNMMYAYQPAYELGKLKILEKLGLQKEIFSEEEKVKDLKVA